MRKALGLVLLVLWPAWAAAEEAAPGTAAWKFSGYYKNLLTRSETVFPAGERYTADLNRLRLKIEGQLAPNLAIDLQYDNEVLLGSYLRTAQFRQQIELPTAQYWRLDANYHDTGSLYARHRLYRASVNWSAGDVDLRIGRQRIAWGTGRFWSPLDVINPLSLVTLEREERLGVDAVLAERKFGPLSRASLVYAPSRQASRTVTALQWHDNVKGWDYSLIGGKVPGARLLGADLAGQVGQAGIRAELGRFEPDGAPAFTRWLVGVDYAFANSLTVTGELYFNGAGARHPSGYDLAGLFSGQVQAVGRRYAGLHASYEITPLLKWENNLAVNLADHSRYFFTALTYSLKTDLELRGGLQRFSGRPGTEYRALRNAYFVQVQRYF